MGLGLLQYFSVPTMSHLPNGGVMALLLVLLILSSGLDLGLFGGKPLACGKGPDIEFCQHTKIFAYILVRIIVVISS